MTTQRVLLVSDRATGATGLETRLDRLGYEVAAVASPEDDAVAVAASIAPDMVLMDMPLRGDMDGAEVADAIQGDRPVPVVLIGPAEDEPGMQETGSAEAHPHLVPPFGDRELRLTLELALCRYDAAEAIHDLEHFFDISIDMFCFMGLDGYFKRLNPAWERTLGFTREELMSRPFLDFVHPDDRERTLEQNARVRGGNRAIEFENRYLCKDGSYRWLLWNATSHSAHGVIYSAARDITDRKRVEAERERLVRELEASLAEVRTLRDILPICTYCKKIRDDEDYWQTVESYVSQHTRTRFSHGICPDCMATEVEPDLREFHGG